jgi:hypothetical protein
VWQRDPNSAAIDEKLNVDRVRVPRGNSDNQRLIDAMNRFFRPAVEGGEVVEHNLFDDSGGRVLRANAASRAVGLRIPERESPLL